MYSRKKRFVTILLASVLAVTCMPILPVIALADSSSLDITLNIGAGDSNKYINYDFEAGKSYSITASWSSIPVFTGSLTGWRLQTVSDSSGTFVADLVIKTAKKQSTSGNGTSSQNYVGVFTPTQNMPVLNLYTQGLVTSNSITIEIEPAAIEEDVLLDATISVDSNMEYISAYFDVNFEVGKTYAITAGWSSAPVYSAANEGKTAWKIQGAQDSDVAGDDAIIYKTTASGNTAAQTYTDTFSCTAAKPVFNFFTQRLNGANQIYFRIERVEAYSTTLNIGAGDSNKYINYYFEAGKSYSITASWSSIPVFTGSLTGWRLQTVSDSSGTFVADLVIKTAKKQSTSGNGTSSQNYVGVFTPTQNMPVLNLYTQGLVTSNSITIEIEPAVIEEDVLLDATISVDSNMEYISAYFDVNFEVGKTYAITAAWSSAPVYTAANEGKTAWKIQRAQDSDIAGDDAIIYKTTTSDNTAAQTYQGTFFCTAAKPVFNFFAQRLSGANQIHFRINLDSTLISDQVTYTKLFQVSKYSSGNVMQGFDIFNNVLFQCYDAGYCITYNATTGTEIADFQLGSAYSTNHCGNVNFGLEYPSGNSQFPALYVSGDLSTKACYVENVTSTSANLIQTIYFDINPSYYGGQIIIDRDRNRIVYMQRQNTNISDLGNVFKICEFRIPALSEGNEIHFTNADILGSPYELPYYSPLYQGGYIHQGRLLQTHGLRENSLGSMIGIMNFDVVSHKFERHIDLTNAFSLEPQGITVYQGRLIMSVIDGNFYEITIIG